MELVTLEKATTEFLAYNAKERDAMFGQGDVCKKTCAPANLDALNAKRAQQDLPPLKEEDVLVHIGKKAKRGRTTMYGRLLVSRMFPEDLVIPDLFPHGVRDVPDDMSWSHYLTCAEQWSEDAPNAPYEWLHYALVNGLSVSRLKKEITAKGGDPGDGDRPVYWLDGQPCRIKSMNDSEMVLEFDGQVELPRDPQGKRLWPHLGTPVFVTAIQPALEKQERREPDEVHSNGPNVQRPESRDVSPVGRQERESIEAERHTDHRDRAGDPPRRAAHRRTS